MAFFPAHATDLSWSVAVARAVELSPAAVAFALLSSEAAEPAVEFAPFAVDVAVEFVEDAEEALAPASLAVDVEVEWSTAVDDACDPSPGAAAFAVESCAPELAAAPVWLLTSEVAELRWDAAAVAGPPVLVEFAVDGMVGSSGEPPLAEAPTLLVPPVPGPAPAVPVEAASAPLAPEAAPVPAAGCPPPKEPAFAEAPVERVPPLPCAVLPGPVVADARAVGGPGGKAGSGT